MYLIYCQFQITILVNTLFYCTKTFYKWIQIHRNDYCELLYLNLNPYAMVVHQNYTGIIIPFYGPFLEVSLEPILYYSEVIKIRGIVLAKKENKVGKLCNL